MRDVQYKENGSLLFDKPVNGPVFTGYGRQGIISGRQVKHIQTDPVASVCECRLPLFDWLARLVENSK